MNIEDIFRFSSLPSETAVKHRAYAYHELSEAVTIEKLQAICNDHVEKHYHVPGFMVVSRSDYDALLRDARLSELSLPPRTEEEAANFAPLAPLYDNVRIIAMPSLKPGMVVLGYAE